MAGMSIPTADLLLRVNGIQAGLRRRVWHGQSAGQRRPGRRPLPPGQRLVLASCSGRTGSVVRHTLIDCGMGVVPSLLDFEQSHGVHVVHEVLLTHPHFDHFAQLDWLSMCLVQRPAGAAPAAAGLRQPGVLGERPQPRAPLPG